jgi:hypothetical protein
VGFTEVSGLWSKQQWDCIEDQPLSLEPFPVFHAGHYRAHGLPNCNALILLKGGQGRFRLGQGSITKPGRRSGNFGQLPNLEHEGQSVAGRNAPPRVVEVQMIPPVPRIADYLSWFRAGVPGVSGCFEP